MSFPKRILVTGATGFIGSHLVDALIAQKEIVRCLIRKQDKSEFLPHNRVEVVVGDITEKKTLVPAMSGVDIIYHLAARTDFEGKSWREYYLPNVLGTQNLIDLAIKEKVKRFIFFSTIRVIGLKDTPEPIDEMASYNPINFYDKSKVEAEKLLIEACGQYCLPVVILRPASVYGPRDRGTYYSFFKAISEGKFFLIGNGENLVSFVFVKNVVEAAVLAGQTKSAVGQIYFISDNCPYTIKKISQTIAKNFGRKIPLFHPPKFLGYLTAYGITGVSNLLGVHSPLTPQRVRNLTINYVFDIKKAKKELGYNPQVGLEEGVKETVFWYKQHGWI